LTAVSRAAFDSVASLSHDALVLVDGNGAIATCNEAFARLFDVAIEELLGRSFEALCVEPAALTRALKTWRRTTAPMPARLTLQLGARQHACRIRGRLFSAEDPGAHLALQVDEPGGGSFGLLGRKLEELTAEMRRREHAETATRAAAERMQRLQRFTATLGRAHDVVSTGETIVREGIALLGATLGACVWLPLDGAPHLIARHGNWSDEALAALEAGATDPLIEALKKEEPVWTDTAQAFAAFYPQFAACLNDGAPGAAAALPIRTHERTYGAVLFGFQGPSGLAHEQRELLVTLVELAAQALQRAELFMTEQRARQRLDGLRRLGDALASALTVAEVASVIVSRGKAAARADTCTLYLFDATRQNLLLVNEVGCAPEVIAQIQIIPIDSSNVGAACARSGTPSWVETQAEYVRLMPELAQLRSASPRARAFWCVPLSVEGETLGVLGMGYHGERQFAVDERAFVLAFSQQCADALRRAERIDLERAARATAESAQQSLKTTLSSIGDGVIATDAAGVITFMNPVAEGLTGYPQNEALGKPLSDVFRIVHEHTRASVENPVARVLRDGRVVGLANHSVLLGRQREVPIDDSGAPIRSEAGVITGVVLVFRDVTEKKRAEVRRAFLAEAATALAESLDYRAILGRIAELSVPELADWCAVDMLDDDGRRLERIAVAHVDPAKVELARELAARYPPDPNANYGAAQVVSTGVSAFYPEISDDLLAAVSQAAGHLTLMRDLQMRSALVVPIKGRHRVRGALTLVHAESNRSFSRADLEFVEEFAGRAGIASENAWLFAAEQRAHARAEQASRAKDQFLATVSHELRTPLNAILGWSRLLSTANDEQQRRRSAEVIERNAVAMAQLIEDLLDVSRILSGKMRIDVEPVDLAQVARAAMESVRPAADAKGIRMSLVPGSVAAVTGDPARLQQVVWNLLSNAVKFTPRGGRVEVVLRQAHSTAEILVSDTGQGIDPAFLPYAFDSFRQQDGSSTRQHGGLGLGLAIVKHLVELHGGRIEARSDGEGRGATFIVRLPVSVLWTSNANFTPTTPAVADRPANALEGIRVLVVDDDADARVLLQAFLRDSGGSVTTAASVEEAMAALTQDPFDVLLSDIGMPGEDGFDLIRRVRGLADAKLRSIPAAALTAYARAEDRRKVLQAGYLMHLPKPLEPAEVIAVVETLARVAARD
jgi:PAS domain S-box-containing protein